MTNKKIIFSDLDGTLLNDQKEISPKMHDAIMKYMDAGNILVLSSGRPVESIKAVVNTIDVAHDNLYLVGFNGSVALHYMTGKKIIEKSVDPDTMKKVAGIASKHGIYIHAYSDTHIITGDASSSELAFYRRTVKLPVTELEHFPEDLTAPSCKLLAIIDTNHPDKLMALGEEIQNTIGDSITCLMSNDHLLEVFSSTAGKGQAVVELCQALNIDIANSYAAGDEQNDISMIESAGCGIAMLNGRDIVKECADVITENDNNNDGLLPYFVL